MRRKSTPLPDGLIINRLTGDPDCVYELAAGFCIFVSEGDGLLGQNGAIALGALQNNGGVAFLLLDFAVDKDIY